LLDELLGLSRERRALEEHALDALTEVPHRPPFDTAHLEVEVAGERVLQVGEHLEVAPGQLSPRRGDNLAVGERGRELDHVPQRLVVEAATVALCQLSRRRGDNLPAVLRAAALENMRANVV